MEFLKIYPDQVVLPYKLPKFHEAKLRLIVVILLYPPPVFN